jgi:O-antigen/teichoic acid export membrane protein
MLFALGAVSASVMMINSYVSNLNYACANLVWPIIPAFLILQLTLLGHWLLARAGYPLYAQFLPYLAASLSGVLLSWLYVRASHPDLAAILPLKFDFALARSLFEKSLWFYLAGMGNLIYRATDQLVINAGFGPVPSVVYFYNYKFCDLATTLIITASFVAVPKITQWMASSHAADQARAKAEIKRLNIFQIFCAVGAALAYLLINDFFVHVWLGKGEAMRAPLSWQIAYALNLVVTCAGDAGIQLTGRCGENGVRVAGSIIGLTGLLNLGLSILAMEMGHIWGVAGATVLAQSVLSLGAGLYVCRYLKIAWLPWALRSWLLPLAAIGIAAWLRMQWPMDARANILLLTAAYAAILIAAAWGLGVNAALIKDELKILRKFVGR